MEAPAERLPWRQVGDEPTLPGLVERRTHPGFGGIEFLHVRAKSLINHVPAAANLPFEYTINVYRGCTHACSYCFARPTHRYLELDPAEEFESVIVVKVNAVERLRAELRAPSWEGDHIAMGTNTDPYQRCEGRYRLTRGVVELLTRVGNPYSILTKGTLVTRDLDVFVAAQRRRPTPVNLSVPTLDEEVWRRTEPGTPHPRRRLQAVAELNDAGVPSGVMVAPVIPGLSDGRDQLAEVVRGAVEAGATFVRPIVLHLRPGVRDIFLDRLARWRPDLLDRYERLYAGAYADRAYRRRVGRLVGDLVEEAGGVRGSPPRGRRPRPREEQAPVPGADPEQLDLGL